MNKIVFFDRDGTLNELCPGLENRGPRKCSELIIVPEAKHALDLLAESGYISCIVTNQPDISRGLLSQSDNACIEKKFRDHIPSLVGYLVCPHDNSDSCLCRKPLEGMLVDFMHLNQSIPINSWIVGDKWTDILAGKRAGVKTILLRNESSFADTSQGKPPRNLFPDFEVGSLLGAVQIIIGPAA